MINRKKSGCTLALYTKTLPNTFLPGPAGKGGAAQPSAVQGHSKLEAVKKPRTPESLLALPGLEGCGPTCLWPAVWVAGPLRLIGGHLSACLASVSKWSR